MKIMTDMLRGARDTAACFDPGALLALLLALYGVLQILSWLGAPL